MIEYLQLEKAMPEPLPQRVVARKAMARGTHPREEDIAGKDHKYYLLPVKLLLRLLYFFHNSPFSKRDPGLDRPILVTTCLR